MALAVKLSAVSPARTPDALETLLRELITEVRGLRADLARDRRPVTSLSRSDRTVLARLLPAIGGVVGSELFVTRDLFESDAAALQLVLRGLNAKQVGRLLRRGEGQAIDGYVIQRDGTELHAVLWRVVRAPEFLTVQKPHGSPTDTGTAGGMGIEERY
jgi:hypothetical protein